MGFFDEEKNVDAYIEMAEGYDGRMFIPILHKYLPDGASVLELGMGPGVDMDLLAEHFTMTGSDSSQVFLDRYKTAHPDARLLKLDAANIELEEQFDGIFSNKVLMHLEKEQIEGSLAQQAQLLSSGGIALHSLWYGEGEDENQGLHFTYLTPDSLQPLIPTDFEVPEMKIYKEFKEGDSFYVVLKKK